MKSFDQRQLEKRAKNDHRLQILQEKFRDDCGTTYSKAKETTSKLANEQETYLRSYENKPEFDPVYNEQSMAATTIALLQRRIFNN